MPVPFFDLSRQYAAIQSTLSRAIDDVLRSQRFIMGPEVKCLEDQISALVGSRRAVACASGTDALLLPLRALEVSTDDEVIVPSFTFFATAGAAANAGFRPVFCDVEECTFNMSARTVLPHITSRTRAIVVVHLFGQMAPMSEIMALAAEHGLSVVEDVAQSMGATQLFDGVEWQAGSIGHAGAFSFFPTKNLGGFGDGGMIVASDDVLADKVALLRTHGGRRMYHHEFIGTNSRLDSIQASVLLAKLPHLASFIEARRRNAEGYWDLLADVPEITLPVEIEGNYHTYNQFTILTDVRDQLRSHLTDRGIGSNVYYPQPLHTQPCFEGLWRSSGSMELPVSDRLCDRVLSLPIFPELTSSETEQVADAIRGFFGRG